MAMLASFDIWHNYSARLSGALAVRLVGDDGAGVIDPAETRDWRMDGLRSLLPMPVRAGKKCLYGHLVV